MSWLDRFQRASFRGVEFRVEAHASGTSRRLSVHEFPGLDKKLIFDLGRGVDTIRMRAYVVGENYDLQRNALVAACQQAGPGTLVHPYLGSLQVRCTDVRWEERSTVGGIATLALTFIEAGESAAGLFPAAVEPRAAARDTAAATQELATQEFAERLEGVQRRGRSAASIAAQLESFAAFVRGVTLTGPFLQVARARRAAERLADAGIDLVAAPLDLASDLRALVIDLAASIESRRERVSFLLELLAQSPTRPSTPVSGIFRAEEEDAAATADLIRLLAAAEALAQGADVEWSFLEEATDALASLQAGLDDLAAFSSDSIYRSIRELGAAAARVLPPQPGSLPSLSTQAPPSTVPAVVLAYRLYGDRGRAQELLDRNPRRVRHPGRLAGGVELEVLSQ